MCVGYQPSKGTNLRYIYVLITNVIAIGNAVSKRLKLFLSGNSEFNIFNEFVTNQEVDHNLII